MYVYCLRASAAAWLCLSLLGLGSSGCSLDRTPAPIYSRTDDAPLQLRDRSDRDLGQDAGGIAVGTGVTDPCEDVACQHGGHCVVDVDAGARCECAPTWSGASCERNIGGCKALPCANGGECQELDAGIVCSCVDGWSGDTCSQRCGDGRVDPGEACDDGADNGKPERCSAACAFPEETISIRRPAAGARVENPVFFDWEIGAKRAGTKYCQMLMTDHAQTPEDLIGEQAFYAGTDSELVLTLNSQRYRNAFAFAIIVVACDDPSVSCGSFDCFPGQTCSPPCAGRTITSEVRSLLGVKP